MTYRWVGPVKNNGSFRSHQIWERNDQLSIVLLCSSALLFYSHFLKNIDLSSPFELFEMTHTQFAFVCVTKIIIENWLRLHSVACLGLSSRLLKNKDEPGTCLHAVIENYFCYISNKMMKYRTWNMTPTPLTTCVVSLSRPRQSDRSWKKGTRLGKYLCSCTRV